MKKATIKFLASSLAVFALIFTVSSCKKALKPKSFDAYGANYEITIPVMTGNSFENTSTVKINIDSLANTYKFSRKNIDMIRFKECTATIKDNNASPYSFDIISAFRGYIRVSGKSDLPVIDDSSIEQTGANSIKLDVKDSDIKEYLNSNSYDMYVNVATRDTIDHEFKIELKIKYEIVARL